MIGGLLVSPHVYSFSDDDEEGVPPVSFNVDGGNMYFFDHATNIVYIYSIRGEFRKAYRIDTLGSKLASVRSSEIREFNQ